MTERALWLDGNGMAAMLVEVFGTEMTAEPRACGSCGRSSAVGALRAYRGAGIVLRCPWCDDVALRVAELPDRRVVHFAGTWTVHTARE
jgi:hypothetical protein